MLKINHKVHLALETWPDTAGFPMPERYNFVYRSPRGAFDNIWDLWVHRQKKIAVVAVQGSIATQASFLANLYAAMVPAAGSLQLDRNSTFNYQLSEHPNAAVHAGWLIAMAYLSASIEHKIDSCYRSGIKDFILTGHSQGGGITFLLTAHLRQLAASGKLPADITFKTYCSAGPKPGNLFFAYDYENRTKGGWAFNVVNTADWVPDVPFSIQTVNDFTAVNPFRGAKAMIRKQKFPNNIALRHVYNKLDRPSRRAQRNYERYLGKMVSKMVRRQIPDIRMPEYYQSNYYVRTGNTIVLYPDSAYDQQYGKEGVDKIWQHHFPQPYLFLMQRY
ncbi:MAG: lipase family protein [Chitinophagaceae bacterium]|nr:lipase family protein [Chitinophagaceae bacterium]